MLGMATSQPLTPSQWPPLFKVLCTLLVLGNGIALFSKIAVWMRGNKPSVCTPLNFLFVAGRKSFGAARALDICRVLLELYRLPAISRFGVTILIRRNLPLSCIHFFLFYCLSDERGVNELESHIMEGFQRHRLSPISLQESYKNTLISI